MISKILIVDDSPVARKMLKNSIPKDKGYEIFEATNGQEGVTKYQELKPDLVFMDLQMPEMDGFEITHQIRNRDPLDFDPNIPIIALTANIVETDKQKCIDAGMDDYLTKPFRPDKDFSVIKRVAR